MMLQYILFPSLPFLELFLFDKYNLDCELCNHFPVSLRIHAGE